ncbi:FGGY family carbohydrate kinase [Fluviibacterium sp. DFM31]|uniref:ATP:glycerol 3-phosphotransferase n=1 Tax=Meridianimarinicoccus marinus TaxID=3231483 RepID=A0ABV3L5J2_9RHOB
MTVLAIDQSTTSTTAFLFRPDGTSEKVFSRDHRQLYPRSGWVEHDAGEIVDNIRAALQAGKAAGATVFGLGNQGESCLAWDAETKLPLGPIIVWQDTRTADRCAALKAAGHAALVRERAGLQLSPYFSATKLAWCLAHLPEARRLRDVGRLRLGTSDAYFRDVLTGRFETDVATASRTSLMNLHSGTWDVKLCALFGVPESSLPAITDCNGELGQAEGLACQSAIVDQQAALFGHGVDQAGDTKITFGTGAFALTLLGDTPPASTTAALPTVAWREAGQPMQYALDGGIFTASSALNWVRDLGLFHDFSDLADLEGPPMLARGLVFVPSLSGLGCPHWDEAAKGGWLGLTLDTRPHDMVRAVFEGVALRMAEILQEFERHGPIASPIGVDGGMARNRGFCQFLADVTRKSLRLSEVPERTALGVARLAARASGGDVLVAAPETILTPQADHSGLLAQFIAARKLVQSWGSGRV